MATMKEFADRMTTAVGEVKDAVQPLAGAIDAFEARVTDILKNGSVPQDVADQMDAALADLKTVTDGVKAAVADAADGVDEAASQPPTP